MYDNLVDARGLAEKVRFAGDKLRTGKKDIEYSNQNFDDFFAYNDLPITKELTPELFDILHSTCDRLHISKNSVKAYVYASSELQAECYSANTSECILRISSSLIDILNINEVGFIFGHELGHFLLGHGVLKINHGNDSLEYFMQQRSQEISVDRLGFIATGSIDVAIRALMKTVSGLNDDYLRYDISNYLSYLKKPSKTFFDRSQTSTHPSMLFRCRALLWFSMKVKEFDDVQKIDPQVIKRLDKKVMADLKKYIDGPTREIIEKAKKNLAMWIYIDEVVQDDKFDKQEQEKFAKEFGMDKLKKMINLLNTTSVSEVRVLVDQKLEKANKQLKKLIPSSFEKEFERVNQQYRS